MDIRQYGDPILRKKSQPVLMVDDSIRCLSSDLIDTMLAYNGLGLAAPQIGICLRAFAVNSIGDCDFSFIDIWKAPTNFSLHRPFVIINPTLRMKPGCATATEGCLSIPDVERDVIRRTSVRVTGILPCKHEVVFDAYGLLARTIQHEKDHLDGKLIIDYPLITGLI